MFITVVSAVILMIIIFWTDKEFNELQKTTSNYIECEDAVLEWKEASKYLTEQVHLLVITGDSKYIQSYLDEITKNKRRENSMAKLEKHSDKQEAMDYLHKAMDDSNELMDMELHAILLMIDAYDIQDEDIVAAIKSQSLTEEERSMSKEEKIIAASNIVSDPQFIEKSEEINDDIEKCCEKIIIAVGKSERRAAAIFNDAYLKLKFAGVFFIILSIVLSIALRNIVVKPLMKYRENVQKGKSLPDEGAYELQMLAKTYNTFVEDNKESQELLRYQAEHDALTNILNRGAFEKMLNAFLENALNFALIIIDVDNFKNINDTYGHSEGDKLLQEIARVVKYEFRSTDYVYRIGGDEFAVIMINVVEAQKYVVSRKLDALNEGLQKKKKPTTTLSMGVAFSTSEEPDMDVFTNADKALYQAKENGRNGHAFYK